MNEKEFLLVRKFLNDYSLSNKINYNLLKDVSVDTINEMCKSNMFNMYEFYIIGNIFNSCDTSVFEQQINSIADEYVICILRSIIESDQFQSSLFKNNYDYKSIITRNIMDDTLLLPRRSLEYDKRYLQIIPNMIVTYKGKIVLLHKIKNTSRLYDTVGLPAGHCNNFDIILDIQRELHEELSINTNDISNIEFLGLTNLVNNPFNVSYYHLGLITLVELNDNAVIKNNEPEKHELLFYDDMLSSPDKLKLLNKFENWATESLLVYFNHIEKRA